MAKKDEEKREGETAAPETADSPLLDLSDAAVKRMIKLAKKRGYVTHDELNAVLPSEEVSSDQIEDVYAMLNEMGITVSEAEEDAEGEEASDDTPDESDSTDLVDVARPAPGDAARAEVFFSDSEKKATIEAGRIRAAYWIAEARKAQNLDPHEALSRAARVPLSYYGMLARETLQQSKIILRAAPEPDFDRASGDPLFQAIALLLDADAGDFVTPIASDYIQRAPDAPTLSALAALGDGQGTLA